ncbi:uncharacterized protein DC041_0012770 [Schistosoma bovis]|uniref:Phosphatidic acid phosphatase type 2/haloperoxidase domain-containing protein n=1 Tax=Schistosoma bovis TaxID=6184 RepID=A0A430QEE4_SCHBO|nr:uncharacterized protein DC041_0012770 [Schistosoma bovis]
MGPTLKKSFPSGHTSIAIYTAIFLCVNELKLSYFFLFSLSGMAFCFNNEVTGSYTRPLTSFCMG